MCKRSEHPETAGIAQQDIKLAPAIVDTLAKTVQRIEIRQIQRYQCRCTAGCANFVIQFLKPANRARECDHMGTGLCIAQCSLITDTA